MKDIIIEMMDAARKSCSEIKDKIHSIVMNDEGNKISFVLNGNEYIGELKGRNSDCWVMGDDCDGDKSIALRVFLDGDAIKINT